MGKKSKSRQIKSDQNESADYLALRETLVNLYAFHRDIIFPSLFEQLSMDMVQEIEFEGVVENGRCYIGTSSRPIEIS